MQGASEVAEFSGPAFTAVDAIVLYLQSTVIFSQAELRGFDTRANSTLLTPGSPHQSVPKSVPKQVRRGTVGGYGQHQLS